MKRTPIAEAADRPYQLAIIGGGIHGLCTAWEAASRGLAVILVERDDFGGATSANSLKIIHGGFRRLKSGDFRGTRRGLADRGEWIARAPFLIKPLIVAVPLLKGRFPSPAAFRVAGGVYRLVQTGLKNQSAYRPAGVVSKKTIMSWVPFLDENQAVGGGIFGDGQVVDTERLSVAVAHSAHEAGAILMNYCAVEDIIRKGGRVEGIRVRDRLSGESAEISAGETFNASGPWAGAVGLRGDFGPRVKAFNLVFNTVAPGAAVGLKSPRTGRYYFLSPWRGKTIVGTGQSPVESGAEPQPPSKAEIDDFISDLREVFPRWPGTVGDIVQVHFGILPGGSGARNGSADFRESPIRIDHEKTDGLKGLTTFVGVKLTSALREARDNIQRLARKNRWALSPSRPDLRVWGAENESGTLPESDGRYGSRAPEVLGLAEKDEREPVLKAEVRFAVRYEWAVTLSDVVIRRLGLMPDIGPEDAKIGLIADVMAKELMWSGEERARQIENFKKDYQRITYAAN